MTSKENQFLRNQINKAHAELTARGHAHRLAFAPSSLGSVLNAYREADISFQEAKELLTLKNPRPSGGDPAGTPAVTDLACRVIPAGDAPSWLGNSARLFLQDEIVVIDSISTCGPAGHQTFPAVAVVLEQDSPNPGLAINGLSTVELVEKIVSFVKTRPWEDPT